MPPNLQSMIFWDGQQQIDFYAFLCERSDDVAVKREATLEEKLREFEKPGHCSFIYVGASLQFPPPQDAVLAFDEPDHEAPEDVLVLWGDGSVDHVPFPTLVHILEELSVGRNPPRMPPTLTMDQAYDLIFDTKWRGRARTLEKIPASTMQPER